MRAIEAGTLRPLGVGEILDVSINLYFRHLGRLVKIAAAIVIPITAIIFLLDLVAFQEAEVSNPDAALYQVGDAVRVLDEQRFLMLQLAQVAVSVIGFLLITGAAFKAVSDAYLGNDPDARASIAYAARRMHSLLWLSILIVIGVVIGLFLVVVPGIYVLIAWSVAVPALMVEGAKGSKAIGRSFGLVRKNWWRVFAALRVGLIFIALFQFLLGLLSGAADPVAEDSVYVWALIYDVVGGIATIITAPLQAAIVTVIYYDLRVRKEGFDVALLSAGLGDTGGAQAEQHPSHATADEPAGPLDSTPPPTTGRPPSDPPASSTAP